MKHRVTRILIALSILLVVMFVLAACSVRPLSRLWTLQHTATPHPTPRPLVVAAPEMECPTLPATWQGIKPGQSTLTDVITLAGEPLRSYTPENTHEYPPILSPSENLIIESNLVNIGNDGTVNWIVSWVFDIDGSFHTVAEYVLQYGQVLDKAYQPRDDSHGYVYVWSHCGIAVETIEEGWVKRTKDEKLNIAPIADVNVEDLTLIELVKKTDAERLVHHGSTSEMDTTKMLVFRVYLFEPTNCATFDEFHHPLIWPPRDTNLYHHRFSESALDSEGETIK